MVQEKLELPELSGPAASRYITAAPGLVSANPLLALKVRVRDTSFWTSRQICPGRKLALDPDTSSLAVHPLKSMTSGASGPPLDLHLTGLRVVDGLAVADEGRRLR